MKIDAILENLTTEFIGIASRLEAILLEAEQALRVGAIDGDIKAQKRAFLQATESFEKTCFTFLMHRQPVAKDFRKVSAMLKALADMERIGVQGCDICVIIEKNSGAKEYVPNETLLTMIAVARSMTKDALDAFVRGDLVIARSVIDTDDAVDQGFSELRDEVDIPKNEADASIRLIDKVMIGKYLERIADHACAIAWRVINF